MLFLPAFFVVQLAFATFVSLTVKADVSNVCEDALKRSTNLCQTWKQDGLCGEANVRALCSDSCNLCKNEESENDSPNKYLGCFNDGVQSELKLMSLHHRITVRSCVGACRDKKFRYAGLRDGRYCMCGNDYGSYGEVLKRDGCSKRCGGREACGGSMENAMYRAELEKESKRNNLEDIEKLVLGKKRKSLSRRRYHKKSHVKLSIPKTRSWDFDSWLRKYEEEKERDAF